MTKTPSIKTALLEQYLNLNLHEIETELQQLLTQSLSSETKNSIHAARQALQKRQHYIKSQAMQFEATNDHHLLVFDSTDNFGKIAGRSVLFYALTIADRIHRRYNIKNDTDNYSRSDEGIISIRVLSQLEAQLHEIGIFPDHDLNTPELHFYKLPKTYSEEQIAKLRDKSRQDVARITSIIIPKSPSPKLYNLLLAMNRSLYHNCKRISDSLARDTLVRQIIFDANEALVSYLNFANARPHAGIVRQQLQSVLSVAVSQTACPATSPQAQNLFNILINIRNIRNSLANIENLRLMHHRELCEILEQIVEIERLTTREYNYQLRQDRLKSDST